jgi:hypothetical protein
VRKARKTKRRKVSSKHTDTEKREKRQCIAAASPQQAPGAKQINTNNTVFLNTP